MSTSEGTKNRGSIRHRPSPHPPLVDSYFVLETSSSVVKLHLLKYMRIKRHMLITMCHTTMLNLFNNVPFNYTPKLAESEIDAP